MARGGHDLSFITRVDFRKSFDEEANGTHFMRSLTPSLQRA